MQTEVTRRAYDGARVIWRRDKINDYEWDHWYIIRVEH